MGRALVVETGRAVSPEVLPDGAAGVWAAARARRRPRTRRPDLAVQHRSPVPPTPPPESPQASDLLGPRSRRLPVDQPPWLPAPPRPPRHHRDRPPSAPGPAGPVACSDVLSCRCADDPLGRLVVTLVHLELQAVFSLLAAVRSPRRTDEAG